MDTPKGHSPGHLTPRIILHGGAGNITRDNLSPSQHAAYRSALLEILDEAHTRLRLPGATALDVATHTVTRLEDNPLFNSGHGAVFTTAGTNELEASVMVSRGYRKRGVGIMGVHKARNPILLAREMLMRGEEENGGGAQEHVQLCGKVCDEFVDKWGLQSARPSYFFTRLRWDQHRRALGLSYTDEDYAKAKRDADQAAGFTDEALEDAESGYVGIDETQRSNPIVPENEYIPKGTVGCVVMDSTGTLCAATSTGGISNKLPGRIGDTPTLGAGFWAEEWSTTHTVPASSESDSSETPLSMIGACLPGLAEYLPVQAKQQRQVRRLRGAAMSGTGNGDSFLRINAARTAAAIARFSPSVDSRGNSSAGRSLQDAVTSIAGPGGALQESAADRWGNGEGEGGIIGIELDGDRGRVVFDYNCGGMFHAWVDDDGKHRMALFQDEK